MITEPGSPPREKKAFSLGDLFVTKYEYLAGASPSREKHRVRGLLAASCQNKEGRIFKQA